MKSSRRKFLLFSFVVSVLFSPALIIAAEPATISVTVSKPRGEISPDALGLSYETSLMLPDTNGVLYFRPGNKPLVALFKTLGVKSLRIGGNSVDAPKVPIPDEKDIRAFFDFARAAGVKVIYSVRLEESTNSGVLPPSTATSNVEAAAKAARLIHDDYPDVLDCFAIGNEPYYFKDYAVYSAKWKAIHDAIVAAYPEATFCGPDQNPSPDLDRKMVRDFGGGSGHLVMITQHSYPFGCAYKNPGAKDVSKLVPFDAAESREKMLAPAAYGTYEKIYQGIAAAITNTSVGYRFSECNSYWFSGLKGASDSYASALWAVDYLHWWTDHGADGLDFHNGDRTGGELSMPCRYAAFVSAKNGYEARPLAYGMKLFDLGGHGKSLAVNVSETTNLVAYAALETNIISVTIINKAHGSSAKKQMVKIKFDTLPRASKVEAIFLRAGNDDIADGSGDVTLGGAPIEADGSWNGRWKRLPRSAVSDNVITITMPPASAAVVKIF
ncbi:MAG TPA: hypothetical protein VFV23_13220 [Verrucomicrobiae bacterium]|nr:hypothetical protein [Verrucomicrobiae bacterium]